MPNLSQLQSSLLKWYQKQKRPLPWRKNKNPYRIWVSEIMLQQTTVTAVIPYYEKFMKRFPNLKALAEAPLGDVLEHWAGLGYYSRARNIHRSAQLLQKSGFPQSYEQLIEYPGFGPYTARAVTSIAFSESVGVLDGNVIRVLSRLDNTAVEWWKSAGRNQLQSRSDGLVQNQDPAEMNQALMELGATICTPKSPACLICPWQKHCQSFKAQNQTDLPLSKPKREKEIWIWSPSILQKKNQVALIKNEYAPFLKGQWLYPGQAKKTNKSPKKYLFKHNITHHEIYVQKVSSKKNNQQTNKPLKASQIEKLQWVNPEKLHEWNASALLKKVLKES